MIIFCLIILKSRINTYTIAEQPLTLFVNFKRIYYLYARKQHYYGPT